MRNLLRPALRLASAFVIFSPVYSAIFRRRLKCAAEKQPLPSIADFLIDRPRASVNLIRKGPEAIGVVERENWKVQSNYLSEFNQRILTQDQCVFSLTKNNLAASVLS